jgi:hypothetical protein
LAPDDVADDYKSILERADQHFTQVMEAQPQNLQCGAGCSLCCYGLFEIGSGDVPVVAEGLAGLHPARRKKIVKRALEIVESSAHPNLRECSPAEKEPSSTGRRRRRARISTTPAAA